MKQLTLSQSIEGFLLEKQAQHLSPHTVADYTNAFRKFQASPGHGCAVRRHHRRPGQGLPGRPLHPARPDGVAKRPVKGLSNKTILNIHTALSALWTWAVAEGIVTQHLLRQIPRPKPPYGEARDHAFQRGGHEDAAGLAAANARAPTRGPANAPATTRWPLRCATGRSSLLLLDTGVRAS